MIKFRYFLLNILSIVLFLPVQAQYYSPHEIKLAERLHSLAENAPPELAYIQTSKDIFETGEDLWFKVYLLDAQYLAPSLLSKTLYLQLLNENNKKTVWQEKYEIQNGFANGRVYLDPDLPEGDYLLAACTSNSFFNDTTEFKAIRKIKVIADISSTQKGQTPSLILPFQDKNNRIQFNTFPEGGNLVSGIQARLAFKAVNTCGEPVDVEGTLFADSMPLLHFSSLHAGMGSFSFIPDAYKKYSLKLSEPATDSTFAIPEIFPSGITIQLVERAEEFLTFKVSRRPGLSQEDICLRVQCRGAVYGMTTAVLDSELRIKVPLEALPQGISEVTLFDSNLVPVAERLVYINKDQKLNITAELSKEIFPTRGKATLKITVKDIYGEPVKANLGISVFDKLYQEPRDSNNILAHYYLSAQLKGRIYNPSFYFNNRNKNCDEALDLLLLTQGWRKYIWNEMALKKSGKIRQVISDEVSGIINYPHRRRKVPGKQVFVMAFSPNMDSLHVLMPADSVGGFTVSTEILKRWETDYVYLKTLGPPESQLTIHSYDPLELPEYVIGIKLTDPFKIINSFMTNKDLSYPLPALKMEFENPIDPYKSGDGLVKIKEVTIKGRRQNIIRGKYLGVLDSIARENDYVCSYGVLNCPRHTPDEPSPISLLFNGYGEKKPIRGKEYFVIYNYNTPAERVSRITYKPKKYSEEDLLKINNLARLKAYYGPREFYQPNYDIETPDEHIPDFRNTLLWAPSVITNEDGEATLSFYCSDINTDFIGRIEGVSGEGLLGTGYFKFTVRKLKPDP